MSEQSYQGTCHCGAVRFEVTMEPPTVAYACNCSICSRAGWLLASAKADKLVLSHASEAVTDYQFGKKKTHHFFCNTCGCRAYSKGTDKDGTPTFAVNLRCVQGIDTASLPVHQFDGASL